MIELLADLDLFQGVDDETLAAFAVRGVEGTLEVGDPVTVQGKPVERFVVIAEGTIEWSRSINGVDTVLSERHGPTYSGASNLLTGDPAVATGRASTPAHVITWDADSFLAFLHDTPLAMRTAVRLIAPIAQAAESIVRQQEKLAALGTLSAGLAHELNNPAAAARRTASELAEAMETLQDTAHQFVSSGLERGQVARLVELQQAARKGAVRAASGDAMDAADREDALAARLDELGADGWRLAEPLARAGVDDAWLEQVAEAAGSARVAALEWVAASLTATGLVAELHESTARISELVSAIKDYTHMDRAAVAEVDLHEGLDSTLTILGHRLKKGSVTVERHYDRSLPRVTAHGSELNQVWTNLIVNSLDAIDGNGTITITTRRSTTGGVVVDIADDGPGIPPEQQSRVYEPFFTTKGVGEGSGLGLDIVRRIVAGHRGDITLRSQPGATVFTVTLPAPAAV
ncbi:MAG TPA: ATP-binding protein [Gaiellales bacterium]|nr:ATP-binding protein [Gaiellales bacterium]